MQKGKKLQQISTLDCFELRYVRGIFLLLKASWTHLKNFSIAIQNQIFHYNRCIAPERVTSWRGPFTRHCAWATKLLLKKCRSGGELLAPTVPDLTGPRFETQTSRPRDEHVTAHQLAFFFVCNEPKIFCHQIY